MTGLVRGVVVIWLDSDIGNPDRHSHLKAAFSSNVDPTNPEPIKLVNKDTKHVLFNNSDSEIRPRIGIPCELKIFVESVECSRCIDEGLKADKQIFLIISDSIGKTFVPDICKKYPEAFQCSVGEVRISIYIFSFYMSNNMDWLFDYGEYVLVFSHEVDLLYRLVRDIAIYYTEAGKKLLVQDTLVDAHQALTYLEWASALSRHAKTITVYQDSQLAKYLETLIRITEEKIKTHMKFTQNSLYSRAHMERNLENSIFIYYSEEFRNEAEQLLSMLHNLTNEQGTLFDSCDTCVAKLQTESCGIKLHCPIIISSNSDDRMKTLKELSSLQSINQIYVLDSNEHIPCAINDQTLLESFPKVRNIYLDTRILALEWTAERASTCEKIGDFCTENDDPDSARMYYAKAIELNKHLSDFIKNR
jgi:hypothetical protein